MLHLNGLDGMCVVTLVQWAGVSGIYVAVIEVNPLSFFESAQPHYQAPKYERGCFPRQSEILYSYSYSPKKKGVPFS